jgi:hypothetical protein
MPNANVIARMMGANTPAQGVNAIPSLTLASNTETLFLNQAGNPAVIAPFPPGQVLGAAAAPSFGSGFDGFPFKVRCAFKVTTGGTSTAIIAMYVNQVSTTITSGNKIATVTSQSLVTLPTSGFLESYCIWDSVSLKLNGIQSGAFGTTAVSAIANTTTNIAVPALANLNFSVTANLGSNVAGSIFTITEFVVETV